jgi:hypothetical protein
MKVEKINKIECKGCEKGIAMCYRRPCWGTVKDFKKIIEAGFAHRLMIDYYNSKELKDNKRIYFLSGANNGNECSKADWDPIGVCSFLENNSCSIHDIKPTMGAISCCKTEESQRKYTESCIATWDTEEGIRLIKKWKSIINYIEKEDDVRK